MERKQLHKNTASCIEQVLEAASHKAAVVQTSQKPSKLDEQDTAGEVKESS